MIIQILSNLCEEGYLGKDSYSFTSPFFSGANVAFRRQVFEQIGLYDENCTTGEDHDICLRAAYAGWGLYFQPKAVARHNNKGTIRGFIGRWFGYGLKHPYVFKKHNLKSLQIYRMSKRNEKQYLYKCICCQPRFPIHAAIFVTPFLIMHIFLLLTIALILLGSGVASLILGFLTFVAAISYIKYDIDKKHPRHMIILAGLRYAANMALLIGGLLGGLKLRTIYASGTLDYRSKNLPVETR